MAGFLTSVLLFDELFQIHRILYPLYGEFAPVPFYGLYGIIVLWGIRRFGKQIRGTEFPLICLALFFYFLAAAFDTLPLIPRGRTAFSDGLKLFGIVSRGSPILHGSVGEC